MNTIFLAEVNGKIITFNLADNTNTPASVEYKVFSIESDMFFKVIDCFKYIAETLCKV